MCILIVSTVSNRLMPIIVKYGEYEFDNTITKLTNEIVAQSLDIDIKEKIITYDENLTTLDFNMNILNSISVNTVSKLQYYLYQLEHGNYGLDIFEKIGVRKKENSAGIGFIYEIPIGRALNIPFLSNLGMSIPIRYQFVGEIGSQLISNIKEYGINGALLEINLHIFSKTSVISPTIDEEREMNIKIPLVVKIIQGKVPDAYLGSQVLGG